MSEEQETERPLVEVRGLAKAFGGVEVLRDIAFAVPSGSVTLSMTNHFLAWPPSAMVP